MPLNGHVKRLKHRLDFQSNVISMQMYARIFQVDFPHVDRKSLPSLWVLAVTVLTRVYCQHFCGVRYCREEKEHRSSDPPWVLWWGFQVERLEVSLLEERGFWPYQLRVKGKIGNVPNWDWFGVTEHLCSGTSSARPCSRVFRSLSNANSVRHEESQTSLSKPPKHECRDPPHQQIHKAWSSSFVLLPVS